jgi:hypothetical protein
MKEGPKWLKERTIRIVEERWEQNKKQDGTVVKHLYKEF